ncbi:MAG: hypothetical protein VB081_12720 [Christensenella sp.]|uniref:hypothetical protein n=1 Tax=Christensenella sp. TaxID=1935934 RepID=UPI002B20194D|nr:hypothetical protein [Christensenella sp.]MEA5004341.1 hypothetical protein [Christensenella sp.]
MAKTNAQRLIDKTLALKSDTDDPFVLELNRDTWEQDYKNDRTQAYKKLVSDYADGLLKGTEKPSEGLSKGKGRTDGDLADPFIQGLWGEQELKNDFMRGQVTAFTPALDARPPRRRASRIPARKGRSRWRSTILWQSKETEK